MGTERRGPRSERPHIRVRDGKKWFFLLFFFFCFSMTTKIENVKVVLSGGTKVSDDMFVYGRTRRDGSKKDCKWPELCRVTIRNDSAVNDERNE